MNRKVFLGILYWSLLILAYAMIIKLRLHQEEKERVKYDKENFRYLDDPDE
jgi:hypothetical protein